MAAATQTCPDAEVLATYVSGSLREQDADALFAHLDHCQGCQRLVDDMARRADSLVAALRQPVTSGTVPTVGVEQLIDQVKKLDPQAGNGAGQRASEGPAEPVSLDRFLAVLVRSRLVEASELEAHVKQIQPTASISCAQELVERSVVTPFQARQLLRGRWRGLVLDDYVVLEKLGQGGMGQVYKSRKRDDDRIVCLKVLHPDGMKSPQALERFHREAKTLAVLDHPNIVVAHESGECDGIPFLVMELIDGSDLGRRVRGGGPLPPSQAVEIILQATRAMAYAHGRGIIHRDLKPQNLLLDTSGNVKVLDLGLARFDSYLAESAVGTELTSITRSGFVMGTIDYIAPEQAVNSKAADYRSDVYSLGCTLYYLLTGRAMYPGETIMERLVAHREKELPRLSAVRDGLPKGLEQVFERMVAKDPANRYQSMTELARDLEELQSGRMPIAPSPRPAEPASVIHQLEPAEPVGPPVITLPVVSPSALESTVPDASPNQPTLLEDIRWPDAPVLPNLPTPQAKPAPSPVRQWLSPLAALSDKLLWGGAGVVALVTLLMVGVAIRSGFASPHPDTLSGGGPGRAVVMIPFEGYNDHDYAAAVHALQKHGIEFVTASDRTGKAHSMKGKHMLVDVGFDQINPEEFDALIVCGGKKAPAEQARSLVNVGLRNGKAVAAVGGWETIKSRWPKEYQQKSGFEVANESGGHLLKVCSCGDAPKLVDYVFNELLLASE